MHFQQTRNRVEVVVLRLDGARQRIDLLADRFKTGLHPSEHRLEPRIDLLESCVDGVEPRVGSNSERAETAVESTVERFELCINAALETLETRVHTLVESTDSHSKAADHRIV